MTNVHADWFELTEPLWHSEFTSLMRERLMMCSAQAVHTRGTMGYRERIIWNDTVVEQWNDSDERMGRHWSFPGSAWAALSELTSGEPNWRYWIRLWAAHGKGNVTRIDLASDFTDTDARIVAGDILHGMENGLSRKRSWRQIDNSEDGYTMYVGSRQSDVMLRVYDKGAQLDLEPFKLARTEFEVKKSKSRSIGDGLRSLLTVKESEEANVGDWLASVSVGLMAEFIPIHTLERLGVTKWGVHPITIGSWLPRSLSSDAWWWNVVVPALRKRVRKTNGDFDEPFWAEFMERMTQNGQ